MSLRPSNLPKLAVCACYVSNPDAGPAAARGSALDGLFRARMQGCPDQAEMFYQPSADDLAAVEWAVNTLRALVADSVVLTREDDCRVVIPGFENPGTADALILDKLSHADLKTGAMRNYREQMAAYALGLMEAHFASEWTAHLLFCDQRELVTIRFTYREVKATVEKVIAAYYNPAKQPTPCEYCGWCAKAETCAGRFGGKSDHRRRSRFRFRCRARRQRQARVVSHRLRRAGGFPRARRGDRKGTDSGRDGNTRLETHHPARPGIRRSHYRRPPHPGAWLRRSAGRLRKSLGQKVSRDMGAENPSRQALPRRSRQARQGKPLAAPNPQIKRLDIMQIQQPTQGLRLRVMTRIQDLEYRFLRFQVGQMVERGPSQSLYPGAPKEPLTWLFHLRGFGPTRDAALAMAGLSSTTSLHEELH